MSGKTDRQRDNRKCGEGGIMLRASVMKRQIRRRSASVYWRFVKRSVAGNHIHSALFDASGD